MAKGMTRRAALTGLVAAPAVVGLSGRALAAPKTLKISHQFPGGTLESGDFRDRLCRRFAADVEKRTGGAIRFEIYPNSSLMKTFAQFAALRKGALDFSLYPTAYAGGEIQELNLTFMPAIVTTYEQGFAWKKAEIGREMTKILESKGVKLISWVWQSGGIASRSTPIVGPKDASGIKIRGGSREMDAMFKAAGASTSTMPSNELYIAMQTGNVDAAVTSSTSLISFKLEEVSKALTSAGGRSFFFVFEPLLMSKDIFDALGKDEQQAILAAGEAQETFGLEAAKADDKTMVDVYRKAGAKIVEMDAKSLAEWRDVARGSAWKDYTERSANCERWLKLAEGVAGA
jgi:TRAP-type C4-dicarboxylate transport system substrate-binding protein